MIQRSKNIDRMANAVLDQHEHVDVLINNAGKSIRRSIDRSYDRFHDFQRTMQLNYFGPVKLILDVLPVMRERHSGHIINISSIGVQTNPPRFSAYVASKSALDAWTRVVSSECIADDVHFTTIHMPLVKTPMIAPTKLYDRFPTISPEQVAGLPPAPAQVAVSYQQAAIAQYPDQPQLARQLFEQSLAQAGFDPLKPLV